MAENTVNLTPLTDSTMGRTPSHTISKENYAQERARRKKAVEEKRIAEKMFAEAQMEKEALRTRSLTMLKEFRSKSESQEAERKALEESLKEAAATMATMRAEKAEIETELRNLRNSSESTTNYITEKLENDLKQANDKILLLTSKTGALEAALKEAEEKAASKMDELDARCQQFQTKNEESENATILVRNELEKVKASFEESSSRMSSDLEGKDEKISELTQALVVSNDARNSAISQLETSLANIASLEGTVSDKEARLAAMALDLAHLKEVAESSKEASAADLRTKEIEIASIAQDLDHVKHELEICQSEANKHRATSASLSEEMHQLRAQLNAALDSHKEEMQTAEGTISDLKRDFDAKMKAGTEKHESLNEKVNTLQENLAEKEKTIISMKTTTKELKHALQSTLDTSSANTTTLNTQINTARNKLSECEQQLSAKSKELATMSSTAASDKSALQKQIAECKEQLSAKSKELATMSSTAASDKSALQEKLVAKSKELASLSAQSARDKAALQKEVAVYNARLLDEAKEGDALNSALEALKAEMVSATSKLQEELEFCKEELLCKSEKILSLTGAREVQEEEASIQLKALEEKLESYRAELTTKCNEVDALEENIESIREAGVAHQTSMSENLYRVEDELKACQVELQEMKSVAASKTEELEQAGQIISDMREAHDKDMDTYKARIVELEQQLANAPREPVTGVEADAKDQGCGPEESYESPSKSGEICERDLQDLVEYSAAVNEVNYFKSSTEAHKDLTKKFQIAVKRMRQMQERGSCASSENDRVKSALKDALTKEVEKTSSKRDGLDNASVKMEFIRQSFRGIYASDNHDDMQRHGKAIAAILDLSTEEQEAVRESMERLQPNYSIFSSIDAFQANTIRCLESRLF